MRRVLLTLSLVTGIAILIGSALAIGDEESVDSSDSGSSTQLADNTAPGDYARNSKRKGRKESISHPPPLQRFVDALGKLKQQQQDTDVVRNFLERSSQTPIQPDGGIEVPLAESTSPPLAFPDDLPDRLSGERVGASVEQTIAELGLEASIENSDCAAFPCMIQGVADERQDLEKLRLSLEQQYPEDVVRVVLGSYTDDGPAPFKFNVHVFRTDDHTPQAVAHTNSRTWSYFENNPPTQDQLADFYMRRGANP